MKHTFASQSGCLEEQGSQCTHNITVRRVRATIVADKTKYVVMSRGQNAGRCHDIKINNISLDRVEQFKYLRTTLMNQNSVQ